METDPRLITDVRLLSRSAFVERYANPFLGITVVQVDSDQDEAGYDTLVHELKRSDVAARGEVNLLAPVEKRRGANEFSFITVGRAANNDIVIAVNSVSKCHAMVQATGSGYTVMDAESKNGTYLNGNALAPRRPHEIVAGDLLLFAPGITAVFLDAGSAFTWLRQAGI